MDEENIDYDRIEYVTNRKLPNDEGELTGRIKMYSYDDVHFHYTLECPHCGEVTEGEKKMENRPYYIKCEECGENNLIRKMKGQGSEVKRPGDEEGDDEEEAAKNL
ncbi:MAG: hypothetical protein ABEJ62_02960 [Candidatus Nanohaloarchaea archaeon]